MAVGVEVLQKLETVLPTTIVHPLAEAIRDRRF